MSAENLPSEILEKILINLPGRKVIQCRRVCRRWCDIIDNLLDSFWEEKCVNDELREDYKAARYKYSLSWRSVYKALNSWDRISEQQMLLRQWNLGVRVRSFKLLPNRILSVTAINETLKREDYPFDDTDTIIYYNLDTWEECDRIEFDFDFSYYDENEYYVIVIVEICNSARLPRLYMISKQDKKRKFHYYEAPRYVNLMTALADDEIYLYPYEGTKMAVFKIVQDNGNTVLNRKIVHFDDDDTGQTILAMNKSDGVLYLLFYDGAVYRFIDDARFEFTDLIQKYTPDIFEKLRSYGFDWRDRDIYNWILGLFNNDNGKFDELFLTFYGHGNVIMGTPYREPEIRIMLIDKSFGIDHIIKRKPDRVVSMPEFIQKNQRPYLPYVKQIDVLETESSHKIIFRAYRKLYVVEFSHNIERKTARMLDGVLHWMGRLQVRKDNGRKDKNKIWKEITQCNEVYDLSTYRGTRAFHSWCRLY